MQDLIAAELAASGVADGRRGFNLSWADWLNLDSLLLASRAIVVSAQARQESRGAHFRSDYPASDPGLARRSFLTLEHADRIAREAAETQRPVRRRLAMLRGAALHA